MEQVPVLFTGSMRENLDPFRKHDDAQVWAALRRAHLAPLVEANPMVPPPPPPGGPPGACMRTSRTA